MSKILTLTWPAGPQSVLVTGSFDSWAEKLPLVKQPDGSFKVTLPTKDDSDIQFKFIVDGEWKTSEGYKSATDETGNTNNVVTASELDDELTGQDALSAALSTPGIVIGGGAAVLGGAAIAANSGAAEQEESVGKFTEHIDHEHNEVPVETPPVQDLHPIEEEPSALAASKQVSDVKPEQQDVSGGIASRALPEEDTTPKVGELNGVTHKPAAAAAEKTLESKPAHDYGHTETLKEVEQKLEHPEELSYHPSDQPREPHEEPVVLDKQVTRESIEPLDKVPIDQPYLGRAAPAGISTTESSVPGTEDHNQTHDAVAPVIEAASGFTAQQPESTAATTTNVPATQATEESPIHADGELKSLADVAASYQKHGGEVAAEEEYSREAETAPVDSTVGDVPNPTQQNRVLQETESKHSDAPAHLGSNSPTTAATESSHARTSSKGSNRDVNVPTLRSKESKKIKKKGGFVNKLKSIFH